MKIEKFYGETVDLGNRHFVKLGLNITCDKDIKSAEDIEKVSNKLMLLGKKIIRKEIAQLKEQEEAGNEGN